MKILIADDSRLIRTNLGKLLLRIQGVDEIVESHSIISTIRQIEIDKPDLVVLDLQLPDGTGFYLLEHLNLKESRPRVIILTNYPSEANRKKAVDLGAEALFDKSREFNELIDMLRSELEQKV
ncbi:response regulator [Spirochaeta dissipatitropha]